MRKKEGKRISSKDCVWPTKPQISTIWPFTTQFSWSLIQRLDYALKDWGSIFPLSSPYWPHLPSWTPAPALSTMSIDAWLEEGTELFPQVSLFYCKGRSFPEDPSLPPSAPIGGTIVTWLSCKGGWEKDGWCFQTPSGRSRSNQEGGGDSLLNWHLPAFATGNFPLSQSFL